MNKKRLLAFLCVILSLFAFSTALAADVPVISGTPEAVVTATPVILPPGQSTTPGEQDPATPSPTHSDAPTLVPAPDESPQPTASPAVTMVPIQTVEPSEPTEMPTQTAEPTSDVPVTPPSTLRLLELPALGLAITGLEASSDPVTVDAFVPQVVEITAQDAEVVKGGAGVEPAEATDPVGTGMSVQWTAEEERTAVIIVKGDTIGTGTLGISQLVRMAEYLRGDATPDAAGLYAVDFSGDGKITLVDLVAEAQMLVAQGTQISEQEKQEIIDAAIALQTSGGTYKADEYDVVLLHQGDVIYGMLPGQSAFYTNLSTVIDCNGSYLELYRALQMLPHVEFGYREQLGVYTVNTDMWVATGKCLANSVIDGQEAGPGGGTQFVVTDYPDALKLVETVDLHE